MIPPLVQKLADVACKPIGGGRVDLKFWMTFSALMGIGYYIVFKEFPKLDTQVQTHENRITAMETKVESLPDITAIKVVERLERFYRRRHRDDR